MAATADSSPKRRFDRLAIASFVFSILWLYAVASLVGLVLGIVALRRIDRGGRIARGRNLAIAGIVLGALGVGVTVIGFIVLVWALQDLGAPPAIVVRP